MFKKILILGLSMALAIAAVLVFYTTIIKTGPTDITVNNLHLPSLEESIEDLSQNKDYYFNDSVYHVVVDKLELYEREGFLTDTQLDSLKEIFVQDYVPIFAQHCDKKFSSSIWSESDHEYMLKRIAHLRTYKINNGTDGAISSANEDKLRYIEKTIEQYREAKIVAQYSTFESLDDANKKIDLANQYASTTPLRNCQELRESLEMVKVNIGQDHYKKVAASVNELANYRRMTKDEYEILAQHVNSKIQEYENNRYKYGYDAPSVEELKRIANEHYQKAQAYYTKEEINVNTNSNWRYYGSHYDYDIYCSYSNYHKHNTKATMFVYITGYDQFTFKTKNDSEWDYDYVTVELYEQDSRIEQYSTANSSTERTKTFYNLDKSTTYKLEVTYKKDGSNHNGGDCGYIYIPKLRNNT